MQKINSIKTIKSFSESKFKEKGSVFIGQVFQITRKEQSEAILNKARKKFYDATHICFAFRLDDNSFHYSDDGEPSGTAGIRILNAIEHFSFLNTLVLIIRYYGGTKLGVGPLGKAYYQTAFDVLNSAKVETQKYFSRVKIEFDYNLTSQVHHIIKQYSVINIQNKFEEKPIVECSIEVKNLQKLIDELNQSSSGKINPEIITRSELITVPQT